MTVSRNTAPISLSFKLTVRNTRGAGTSEYSFSSGRLTVGRDPAGDIVLDSERVSRSHCVFTVIEGRLVVEDLGSANGTSVNEKRITSPRALLDDDVVRIGDFVITIIGSAPRPSLFLRLKGVSEGFRGTVVEFIRSPSLLGRGEEADVVVIHPSISRKHCRVDRRPDGSVLVSDLGSSNGVVLNGVPITVSQVLQGDSLRLGQVEFVVELPGQSTYSEIPAVDGRASAVGKFIRSRTFLWLVVALLAAVAISIAGWTLGGMRRGIDAGSRPLQIDKVPE